ncbi:MAG: hypothetical protein PHF50_02125 [Patescibacteria group bacterium]|nr:hypothetical protein [Patescibacteria group bacterium]
MEEKLGKLTLIKAEDNAEKTIKPKEKINAYILYELKDLVDKLIPQKQMHRTTIDSYVVKYNQVVALDDEEIIRRINKFKAEDVKANTFLYQALLKVAEERGLDDKTEN